MNFKRCIRETFSSAEPQARVGMGVVVGPGSLPPNTLRVTRAQAAVAALVILSFVALPACSDGASPEPSTPTPVPPEHQALLDLPLAQVVQGSFDARG